MARPAKEGVDYFPLDVNLDKKFKLIEAKYGSVGFGILIKIYQAIYREHGYYYEWDEETALITAGENSCGKYQLTQKEVAEIVEEAVRRDVFDEGMYKKYGILTSHGIQRRYFEIAGRRKKVIIDSNYLLLNDVRKRVYDNINGVYVDINQKNDDHNTQSKVKGSKVKYSNSSGSSNIEPLQLPPDLIKFYQENISRNFITPREADNIAFWLARMDADVIRWAMEQAVDYRKPNWAYIEKILETHYNAGHRTLAAVKENGGYYADNRQDTRSRQQLAKTGGKLEGFRPPEW